MFGSLGSLVSSLGLLVSILVRLVNNLDYQEVMLVSSLGSLVSILVRLVLGFLGVIQVDRPDFLVDSLDFLVPFQQIDFGCLEVSSWVRLLGQVG